MRHRKWTCAALILGTAWVGCSGANQPRATSAGELISAIAASSQTTSETGIFAWETYRHDRIQTILGLDSSGKPLFREEIAVNQSPTLTRVHIQMRTAQEIIV